MIDYRDKHNHGAFTTTANPCDHANGWFHTIKILCFWKKVYFCGDCGRVMPAKEYHRQMDERLGL